MKTNNELIAEFVGAEQYGSESIGVIWRFNDGNDVAIEDLKYDTSWDWLMVPVDKIRKLYEQNFPANEDFIKKIMAHEDPIEKEYIDVVSTSICTPIHEVYKTVIDFINWYNSKSVGGN